MSTVPLTPTSYLVLGYLDSVGAATPYELKQLVAGGVGHFWSFPHSQLYSEPNRLAQAGLVTEQREQTGRRRRLFAITDTGRVALRDWVAEPNVDQQEIRDLGLLKLFFAAGAPTAHIEALARTQRDAHQQRCDAYEAMAAAAGTLIETDPAVRTLELGIAIERASVEFWSRVASDPPRGA